ncbi:MAG: tetratricopeptide repeat protein [Candidatus Woesearchaeota archaeon]
MLANTRKTLSLCMIVKDEERFIEQCINSVKDFVDEIILVDTGSKDKTVEIASSLSSKVKIFHFGWVDDFSAARNFSLTKAACDWILVLDPDELLLKEDLQRIKTMIQSTVLSGFHLIQRTYTNKSDQASWRLAKPDDQNTKGFLGFFDTPILRLFKKDYKFKFIGRVHEDITPSIKEQKQPLLKSDIIIHHYEYSKGKDFVKDKQLYYLDLTLKKISDQPNNPKAYADAGIIYYNYKNDIDKALYYFRRSLEVDPRYKTSYNYIAKILMKKGNRQEAIDVLNKCISLGLKDETAHINLGVVYMDMGRLDEAIVLFNKVIAMNPNRLTAYYNLGLVLVKKGDFSKAIEMFKKAVGLEPRDSRSYIHLAQLYENTGNLKKAVRLYKILVNNNHPHKNDYLEKIHLLESKIYK